MHPAQGRPKPYGTKGLLANIRTTRRQKFARQIATGKLAAANNSAQIHLSSLKQQTINNEGFTKRAIGTAANPLYLVATAIDSAADSLQ